MQAHPSAEKRARQTIKRTAVNKNRSGLTGALLSKRAPSSACAQLKNGGLAMAVPPLLRATMYVNRSGHDVSNSYSRPLPEREVPSQNSSFPFICRAPSPGER